MKTDDGGVTASCAAVFTEASAGETIVAAARPRTTESRVRVMAAFLGEWEGRMLFGPVQSPGAACPPHEQGTGQMRKKLIFRAFRGHSRGRSSRPGPRTASPRRAAPSGMEVRASIR